MSHTRLVLLGIKSPGHRLPLTMGTARISLLSIGQKTPKLQPVVIELMENSHCRWLMMTYDAFPEKQMTIVLYKTTLNNQIVYGLESQIHQYLMAINWGLPRAPSASIQSSYLLRSRVSIWISSCNGLHRGLQDTGIQESGVYANLSIRTLLYP
jgi:hypothetical protein